MKVTLEVIKGPSTGSTFEFDKHDKFYVGRGGKSHSVDFRLPADDQYVSRQHFFLEIAPPRVYFKNLSLTNISHINEIPTEDAELNDGDIIEAGYTQLKVNITAIETKTVHCIRCGDSIIIIADEAPPKCCIKCAKEIKIEESKAQERRRLEIKCSCGVDITSMANSDGQAETLAGVVQYTCDRCTSKMMMGEYAGNKIDAYTVLRLLGEGGYGRVYQVYHAPTGRVMAMKLMLNLTDEAQQHRFERETRWLSELNHPNIVRFIESGLTEEGPYFVMEKVLNGNLEDLMDTDTGVANPDQSVELMIEALRGIEFIHGRDIIHRDLKPQNILLQKNAKRQLVPKVADFGLAKEYFNSGGSLTKLQDTLGTIPFMAPENIRNSKNIRESGDIYSMGSTLYYLLTGMSPFNFPGSKEIEEFIQNNLYKIKNPWEALQFILKINKRSHPFVIILNEDQIPIRNRNPDVPEQLARVIHKAICKDPSTRYQTAAEFRQALERL